VDLIGVDRIALCETPLARRRRLLQHSRRRIFSADRGVALK